MKKNVCNIGGQAVLEGVMMRGKESMATAVRNPAGEIVIESQRLNLSDSRKKIAKIPVLRGIVSFFASFVTGLKITMRASEVYGDMESEAPSKFEKWLAKTFKIDIMNVLMTIGGILGVLLSFRKWSRLPYIRARDYSKSVSTREFGTRSRPRPMVWASAGICCTKSFAAF